MAQVDVRYQIKYYNNHHCWETVFLLDNQYTFAVKVYADCPTLADAQVMVHDIAVESMAYCNLIAQYYGYRIDIRDM